MRIKALKVILLVAGLFQVGYWGLSHIFFPKWYLASVAGKNPDILTTDTVLWMNEIGVSVVGLGVATIIAATNPIRHYAVIVMIMVVGTGSIGVTLYHILVRQASNEWGHIYTVLAQLLIIGILYPWKELKSKKKDAPQ